MKTRSVESVRTFSRSSKGLQFKTIQMPSHRLAYSDLAESVKHLSRGLVDIDNKSWDDHDFVANTLDNSNDELSNGSPDGPVNPNLTINDQV